MSKPSKSQPVVVDRGDGTFYSSHRVPPTHEAGSPRTGYDTRACPPTMRAAVLAGKVRVRESRRQRRLRARVRA